MAIGRKKSAKPAIRLSERANSEVQALEYVKTRLHSLGVLDGSVISRLDYQIAKIKSEDYVQTLSRPQTK